MAGAESSAPAFKEKHGNVIYCICVHRDVWMRILYLHAHHLFDHHA